MRRKRRRNDDEEVKEFQEKEIGEKMNKKDKEEWELKK